MGNARWHRCEVIVINKGKNETLACYVEEGIPRGEVKKKLRVYLESVDHRKVQVKVVYLDPRPVKVPMGEMILIKKQCLITPEGVIYK
jgi:hypothetical protein